MTSSRLPLRSPPRLLFLLTVAQKRVQQWAAGAAGCGATRTGVMMMLPGDGSDRSLSQLGGALDLSASSLSGLVDRMVASELIERTADPADGRACRLHLTEQGRAARKAAIQRANLLNDRLREGFSDEEMATVARWLEAIPGKFPKEDAT